MAKKTKAEENAQEKKKVNKDFISAVGRRKEAVARVRFYPQLKDNIMWGEQTLSKGQILVNQKPIDEYFRLLAAKQIYQEPLRVTNTLQKFAATVKVEGGGLSAQLQALVHGISRALAAYDREKFRPILKKRGFLTRDPRARERRKVGTGGKARRKKQSPKR